MTRLPASSIDPNSWVTFEQAVEAGATNIGFVFSADDPYFVVDLDTYKSSVPENHELLLDAVQTYAERSQSGLGSHVIGLGTVGKGRNSRVHGIEIYDRERFMIVTGNRINEFAIVADQPFADYITNLIAPIADAEAQHFPPSQPSDERDEDLVARMASAQNGGKFLALVDGNVRLGNGKDGDGHLNPLSDALYYESQSEADLALVEMLCFFSQDDEQVARVFLASALGRRAKAQRRDYVPRSVRVARAMIASAVLPLLDLSGLIARGLSSTRSRSKARGPKHPQPGIIITRVSDVAAQPITWFWFRRIAMGKVTIIAGQPGLGKSQATAYLAATATRGGLWPNDEGNAPVGNVIMLSCEDDIADTIRPRLEAAGADVTKVHVIEGVNSAKGDRKIFSVKEDMPLLEAALDRVADVKLVVIDPITAYLDGSDSHNNGDVRAALAPLQDLAMRRGVAVVAVSHLNKSGGSGNAVNAITGSIAFVATARAAFLIARDPDDADQDRRLLIELKNNVSKAPGLAFHIRERILPNGICAPFLEFQPGTVDTTADEALSKSSVSGRSGNAIEDAKYFLIEQLTEGPLAAREVTERAIDDGISDKTLRNARVELGVIIRKETGKNGRSIWSLPLSEMKSNMP